MSWTAVHDLRALCLIFFSWGTVPENSFPDPLSRFMAHSSWDRWVQEEPNNKFLWGNKAKLQASSFFFFFCRASSLKLIDRRTLESRTWRKEKTWFWTVHLNFGEKDVNFRPWDIYFLILLCYSSFLFTGAVCTSFRSCWRWQLCWADPWVLMWAPPETFKICWGFSLLGRVPNRPTSWRSRR